MGLNTLSGWSGFMQGLASGYQQAQQVKLQQAQLQAEKEAQEKANAIKQAQLQATKFSDTITFIQKAFPDDVDAQKDAIKLMAQKDSSFGNLPAVQAILQVSTDVDDGILKQISAVAKEIANAKNDEQFMTATAKADILEMQLSGKKKKALESQATRAEEIYQKGAEKREEQFKNVQNKIQELAMYQAKLDMQTAAEAKKQALQQKYSTTDEYTKQQLVDDTRSYWQVFLDFTKDEYGFVKEGMEDEFADLTSKLEKDMSAIASGEMPSWFQKKETITIDGKEYEIVERLEDGSVRIKDPETGKTGTYRE